MKYVATTLIIVFFIASTPVSVSAATNVYYAPNFNSMTVNEKIAYLLGMITQLQLMLEQRSAFDDGSDRIGVARPLNNRNRADVEIDTLSAYDIEEDEATLRARVDLDGEEEARVWFEYGEDRDLDDETRARRVYDNDGDVQTVYITIDDLDEDERYYYRAVVEDENDDRSYGDVRYFTTDDDRSYSSSNDDYELTLSDTRIDEGDEIEVDWEIPSDEVNSRNWIGLYEVGDDNDEYIKWSYIAADDEGTEEFTIYEAGEYEFRLFLNNSYDDEIESAEFEVE